MSIQGQEAGVFIRTVHCSRHWRRINAKFELSGTMCLPSVCHCMWQDLPALPPLYLILEVIKDWRRWWPRNKANMIGLQLSHAQTAHHTAVLTYSYSTLQINCHNHSVIVLQRLLSCAHTVHCTLATRKYVHQKCSTMSLLSALARGY